jgi:sigma-70-like protein
MESRSDAEVLLATSHEPELFGHFYRRHGERVLRFFATRVRSPEAAADLMAETFATAFANAHRYRQGDEPPVAWLFAIARHLLIDAHRRGEVGAEARKRPALEPLGSSTTTCVGSRSWPVSPASTACSKDCHPMSGWRLGHGSSTSAPTRRSPASFAAPRQALV